MGLRLLKVNFLWLGIVGLVLGVPMPGSLLVARAVETTTASGTLFRPGLVIGVVLVVVGLSGVVGTTKPWMLLETRAETVTRLRSGETESFCGLLEVMEISEETLELVEVRRGFVPFRDAPGDVFMEPVGVSTLFTVTPGDVAAEGEEGIGVSDANDLEAPGLTGGGGARYFILAGCDCGVMDSVAGEDGFVVGVPDGSGAAWDLTDLRLGVRGFDWDPPPEAWGLRGPEEGCGWADSSVGRLQEAGSFHGPSVWSTEHLLSARMVNS